MSDAIVSIQNLKKSYGDLEILSDINLEIEAGKIYGLIGLSGAGKSTLLRCINGLTDFQEGRLLVNGQDMTRLSEKDLRQLRKNIGMIFQNFSLVDRLSVYNNIALPLRLWGVEANQIKERVNKLADLVGIADKLFVYPRQLSGGQKQRVGIARALALEPQILLSDEATSALDPLTTQQILKLLRKINQELGITIIVVTHELDVVKTICHKTVLLEKGRILLNGETEKVFFDQPKDLQTLTADQRHYQKADNTDLISLHFYDYQEEENFLSKLAFSTGINYKLKDCKIEEINGKIVGFYVLEIPRDQVVLLKNFSEKRKIEWRLLQ